jgi:hypothetical protein
VTVDTGRGYRIQGTPRTASRSCSPTAPGSGSASATSPRATGCRSPRPARRRAAGRQLPPLGEGYWTGERHATAPRQMTPSSPSSSATSWATARCTPAASGCASPMATSTWSSACAARQGAVQPRGHGVPADRLHRGGVPLGAARRVVGGLRVRQARAPPRPHRQGLAAAHPRRGAARQRPAVYARSCGGCSRPTAPSPSGTRTGRRRRSRSAGTCSRCCSRSATRPPASSTRPAGASRSWLSCGCSTRRTTSVGSTRSGSSATARTPRSRSRTSQQSARHDKIPVSRELIDRVAPDNDRFRRVMLMEYNRSGACHVASPTRSSSHR